MDLLSRIASWLGENEATISAVVGLTVLTGVLLAGLRSLVRRRGETHLDTVPDAGATGSISAAGAPAADLDPLTVPGFQGRAAIAVLPFDNLSGDPEQEYFADGMVEDLITRLSGLRWFPVIARNSCFIYKGKALDVKQVSRDLGARYVVEGSVRKGGDRVRISAQLIDATSGHHVWAETYDRELRDIFAIQDEITEAIVRSIEPELWHSEWERTIRQEPQDLDAWDSHYRGWWHYRQYTKDETAKARSLFQRASELDPHFAWPLIGLAFTHNADITQQWSESRDKSLQEMERAVRRALALDENDPLGHLALGALYRAKGQREKAIIAFERASRLDPSLAGASFQLGITLALIGRSEEAIASLHRAIRLSPRDIWLNEFLWAMAFAHVIAERFEEALDWAEQSRECKPDFPQIHAILAGCYAYLDRMDEARAAADELLRLNPEFSLAGLELVLADLNPILAERMIEALRKAGLPD